MGTWGAGAFDNDEAADWAYEFDDADLDTGLRLITDALSVVARADGESYLEAPDCALAVAAAAMVTAINSRATGESYSEAALKWIARTRPGVDAALTELASRAVDRVSGHNSELAELWEESRQADWHSALAELKAKLGR